MSKRITGALFCLSSSILFSARYLSAAIHISQMRSYDDAMFSRSLNYVGIPLLILSILCLIIGAVYLISAELDERKSKHDKKRHSDILH